LEIFNTQSQKFFLKVSHYEKPKNSMKGYNVAAILETPYMN